MATQGIVSVVDKDNKTLYKVITGCNGYNAKMLAKSIEMLAKISVSEILRVAHESSYGCKDCLFVMDKDNTYTYHGQQVHMPQYRQHFDDPKFNPRWERGTADHVILITAKEHR